jgi:hypothetical protein
LHGQGKLVWPDGCTYQGNFVAGLREGLGVHTSADGSVHNGSFKQGLEQGKGSVVYGADGGKMEFTWNAGDKCSGTWKAGKRHGDFHYTFFNGDVLECQWSNDVCMEFHQKQASVLSAQGMDSREGRAAARAAAAEVSRNTLPHLPRIPIPQLAACANTNALLHAAEKPRDCGRQREAAVSQASHVRAHVTSEQRCSANTRSSKQES